MLFLWGAVQHPFVGSWVRGAWVMRKTSMWHTRCCTPRAHGAHCRCVYLLIIYFHTKQLFVIAIIPFREVDRWYKEVCAV